MVSIYAYIFLLFSFHQKLIDSEYASFIYTVYIFFFCILSWFIYKDYFILDLWVIIFSILHVFNNISWIRIVILTHAWYCLKRLSKCTIQLARDLRVSGARRRQMDGIIPLNSDRATSSNSLLIPTSPARALKVPAFKD